MRNPRAAAAKLPRSLIAGEAINELLLNAATHPEAVRITKALLGGQKTEEHEGVNAYLGGSALGLG